MMVKFTDLTSKERETMDCYDIKKFIVRLKSNPAGDHYHVYVYFNDGCSLDGCMGLNNMVMISINSPTAPEFRPVEAEKPKVIETAIELSRFHALQESFDE